MDKSPGSTVWLDGRAVRRIREQQKLTQLYVAKVVGVTTDTISRWENNRYPSVKRENVVRLTEALECSLEDILRAPEEDPGSDAGQNPPDLSRSAFWIAGLLILLLLAAVGYVFMQSRGKALPGMKAIRWSPGFAAPGSVIPVFVSLMSEGEHQGFILREHFPTGWKLIESSPPASSLDNIQGTARWIVKAGEDRPRIVYLLKVDSDAKFDQEVTLQGDVVARAEGLVPVPVAGASNLKIAPHHWADLNGDNIIQDSEILQASDIVDEMQGVHLDWNLLENLWNAGQYRYEAKKRDFFPVPSSQALLLEH